jgi:hypothetical protein
MDITFDDIPVWTVEPKCIAGRSIVINGSYTGESTQFKPKRLTTASSADL